MTEQEGKVMKNKKSLLMKYEIPLDHLSLKYVEKCNDRKELERIVKILRSGEEGYYPQLTECAESRLKQIAPESRLLWTEDPVLTKSTLGAKNWNEIAEEMADWTQEMKNRDEALQDCCAAGPDLPAVRQMKNNKLASTEAGPSRAKHAAPRDYSEWDKFDADKEILKMELEDERKREQTARNKKQQEKEKKKSKNEVENSTLKAASNLSSVEKEYVATQEKDRGNEYYRSGDYEEAVKCYSNSIVLCPTPAAYNNRAMAQLKLQKYGEVIADCNQVLKVEPQNVKALHRRGVAHQGKNCYEQAYEDFSKVMELEPENQAAKSLADQMKRKLEPAVKSVRLSIEDECCQPHGFVFPSPKPNIAVNEWGLAKVMCRCNGTPSWVHRKPPKCKICQRKRAERRAKQEEEARKVAEISEVNNGENPEIDQMLTDEKGSGDMRRTEKIVELDTGFVSTMQAELDDSCVRVEEHEMNDKIDFTVESMPTKDEKDTTYTCNVINKENSKSEREAYMDNSKNNEVVVNSKVTSTEANKSKTELNCDTKVLTNEDSRKSPKEVKQKSSAENDVLSEKQMKVKIANKYKKNVNTERETAPEQQVCDVSSVGTITSPFEFVKVWESLKVTSDLSSHAQVLHSVKPSDLASVIGNKLDGPMLSTILMCLENNFAPELVLEYLNNIMKLPRFDLVVMFLQPPEKQAVCRLLEKLEKSDIHPTAALWEAFTC